MKESVSSTGAGLPRGIWVLGGVSLLMDISSELIHGLLPIYLVTVLGANALVVGVVEGLAEATALIVKVFSGVLSDYWGRRKPLALLGYALGALSKPLFPLAASPAWILTARLVDRVGKGIRGAPRDALVADLAPPALRGAAFGLRQSLDTVGAFLGPVLAIAYLTVWPDDLRAVFWIAVVPAWLAVLLLAVGIREAPRPVAERRENPLAGGRWRALSTAYWGVVAFGGLFTFARSSEAFLILRAGEGGLPVNWVPLVLIVMNITFAVTAYPVGRLSDRIGSSRLLAAGLVVLIAADLSLAAWSAGLGFWLGIALWGAHMGLTQGLLAARVAEVAPVALRATAFGVFNLVAGVAILAASVLSGWIWEAAGPTYTFLMGAGLAVLTLLALVRGRGRPRPAEGTQP